MRTIASVLVAVFLCCLSVAETHGSGPGRGMSSCVRSRATSRVLKTARFEQVILRLPVRAARNTQPRVAVVPFAVPVAVPVAIVNTPSVVYGYSGYSARYAPGGTVEPRESVHQESAPQKPALTAESVVTNRCVKCHGGDEPKSGFNLQGADLDTLDRDTRYSMLRHIMEPDKRKRMPKGGQLSREEFDVLVDSLVK